jgi:hypothetical protein
MQNSSVSVGGNTVLDGIAEATVPGLGCPCVLTEMARLPPDGLSRNFVLEVLLRFFNAVQFRLNTDESNETKRKDLRSFMIVFHC